MLCVFDAWRRTISVRWVNDFIDLFAGSKRNLAFCHANIIEPVLLVFIGCELNDINNRNTSLSVIKNIMSQTLHELVLRIVNIQAAPRVATNNLLINDTSNYPIRPLALDDFKNSYVFADRRGSVNMIAINLFIVPSKISKLLLETIEVSTSSSKTMVNAFRLEKAFGIGDFFLDLYVDLVLNFLETLPNCILSGSRKLKSFRLAETSSSPILNSTMKSV